MATELQWDYTELAAHYDKRADYSWRAIDRLLSLTGVGPGASIADIGAGTGKLSLLLAQRGAKIAAVEPNARMREVGTVNTKGMDVVWGAGTAENTGLLPGEFQLVTFGSSFNVVDQPKALAEAHRILGNRGWMACLWNHRDLQDPQQAAIEALIQSYIPGYSYGIRREDPSVIIAAHGYFESVCRIEERFEATVSKAEYVDAWRSHATLHRQAGGKFDIIISAIQDALRHCSTLVVPYYTRLWCAQARAKMI
jgi:ubiquinone/menaquinone biosynthesis C-methylase UbiE